MWQVWLGKEKYKEMTLRGLKVSYVDKAQNLRFCEAEFLAESEIGIANICKLVESMKSKISLTKLHIYGDHNIKYGKSFSWPEICLGDYIEVKMDAC